MVPPVAIGSVILAVGCESTVTDWSGIRVFYQSDSGLNLARREININIFRTGTYSLSFGIVKSIKKKLDCVIVRPISTKIRSVLQSRS